MSPLTGRILGRGLIVFAALVAIGYIFGRAAEAYINAMPGEVKLKEGEGFGLRGPVTMGLFGFAITAFFTWIGWLREQSKERLKKLREEKK